jgi:hypothetical protein
MVSARDDIARRQADARFQLGELRAADALTRKKAALPHETIMTRIAEQRALRLAREAKTRTPPETKKS